MRNIKSHQTQIQPLQELKYQDQQVCIYTVQYTLCVLAILHLRDKIFLNDGNQGFSNLYVLFHEKNFKSAIVNFTMAILLSIPQMPIKMFFILYGNYTANDTYSLAMHAKLYYCLSGLMCEVGSYKFCSYNIT